MRKEQKRIESSIYFEGILNIRLLIENQIKKNADVNFHNDRRIKAIYISEERKSKNPKEYAWLSAKSRELSFDLNIVSDEFIDDNTTGSTHGGIIADCTERTLLSAENIGSNDGRYFVMLDGIEDPYNFGYAIRSLYASGADGIILGERNWMTAASVVARSSAGASEMIPMYQGDTVKTVSNLKKLGYKIICADLRDSIPITESDLSYPLLLIVGGEKRGISREILDMSNQNVRIEYGRDFPLSLSAASAATIAGFEILRQNKLK